MPAIADLRPELATTHTLSTKAGRSMRAVAIVGVSHTAETLLALRAEEKRLSAEFDALPAGIESIDALCRLVHALDRIRDRRQKVLDAYKAQFNRPASIDLEPLALEETSKNPAPDTATGDGKSPQSS